jgi:2-methylisocitrate lyase-like PEP mutase family enzyme
MPNPWTIGGARYLQELGFRALASMSSDYAHSQGHAEGALTRDQALAHFRHIAATVDIPIKAARDHGLPHAPRSVAANVRLFLGTGAALSPMLNSINSSEAATEMGIVSADHSAGRHSARRGACRTARNVDPTGQRNTPLRALGGDNAEQP